MSRVRQSLGGAAVLLAGVGFGLSLVTSLGLRGLAHLGESGLEDAEAALVAMGLLCGLGLVCQGIVGLCLILGDGRPRGSGFDE